MYIVFGDNFLEEFYGIFNFIRYNVCVDNCGVDLCIGMVVKCGSVRVVGNG